MTTALELAAAIKSNAQALSFSLCGIAPAARPDTFPALQSWIQKGYHGEMGYVPRREAAYEHPSSALKSVKSLIVVGASYAPGKTPTADQPGRVAAYAQGQEDYHYVLRAKLKELSAVLHAERPGCKTRVIVDTAPVLERDFARRAGLGWFGKNTMLINKQIGSYFFLAAILTDAELPPDPMHESSHCGTCTRCLEVCPTDAFEGPYILDARKCISYLTIELRGQPIPEELRTGMGEWIFGCDLCQEVCPWNKKPWNSTNSTPPPVLKPLQKVERNMQAAKLLSMSEAEFDQNFANTPFTRPGRENLARNSAIALGNTDDPVWIETLREALKDESELVSEAANWALEKLQNPHSNSALKL